MSSTMLMKLGYLSRPGLLCQQGFWQCGPNGIVMSGRRCSANTGTLTDGVYPFPHQGGRDPLQGKSA
jgi:hypothetical protein